MEPRRDPSGPRPAPRVGTWELREELGRGSYGAVFRAVRAGGGQEVALKLLRGDVGVEDAQRFLREVELLRRLDHPGIVRCLDAGVDAGRAWYAMEFVRGETLQARLRRPIGAAEACALLATLARAVEHVHRQGLVHRDIKPANVILEAGRPRLTDFGLARDPGSSLTRTGEVLGTPLYMSPEQLAARRDVDARADVWALGAILYECLTGRWPYPARSLLELERLQAAGPPERPGRCAPEVPPALDGICLRALAHRREERFSHAGELAEALEAVLSPPAAAQATVRASARPISARAPVATPPPRRPSTPALFAGALALLLVLLLAAVGLLLRRAPAAPDPAPAAPPVGAPDPERSPAWPEQRALGDVPAPPALHDGRLARGPDWALVTGLSPQQVTEQAEALRGEGLAPRCLVANPDGEHARLLVVWGSGQGWSLRMDLEAEELRAADAREQGAGRALAAVSVWPTPAGPRLGAVWEPSDPREAGLLLTSREYQAEFNARATQMRQRQPVWHSALGSGEERRLNLVWARGQAPYVAVHDRPELDFRRALRAMQGHGYTLRCATIYGDVWVPQHGALWSVDRSDTLLVHDLPADEHPALVEAMVEEGYRPLFALERGGAAARRVTSSWERPAARAWQAQGPLDARLEALEAALQRALCAAGVSRAAALVLADGRPLLARGYAWTPPGCPPTPPDARFRLGAVSQLFTALTALRLVETGRLRLDRPLGELLPGLAGSQPGGVTVRQALAHEAGWPGVAEASPPLETRVPVFPSMVLAFEAEAEERLVFSLGRERGALGSDDHLAALRDTPADRPPGSPSDLGYAVLGRALAAAGELDYVALVRRELLVPLQLAGVAPGRTRLAERLPGEVVYPSAGLCSDVSDSGALVPRSYGAQELAGRLPALGWVASALDLGRLAGALEQGRALEPASREAMWTAGAGGDNGLGWRVEGVARNPHAWCSGRLPGSCAHVERLPGGVWLVLLAAGELELEPLLPELRQALREGLAAPEPAPLDGPGGR